jgi:hypothetical protein
MKRYVTVSLVVFWACAAPQTGSPPLQDAQRARELVDRVWASSDTSAAPGTFRIFLANGTLVMDSCRETYRLVPWRTIDNRRIEWMEDTARIEAEIAELTGERLKMRLQLEGEVKEETYRQAEVPMVCRDMPR